MRLTQVLDWLETTGTDALVMQEIKTVDELFPLDAFSEAGFDALVCGQKTYNGVALVTRRASFKSVSNPIYNIPGYEDAQKRLIAATLELKSGTKVRFAGAYFPNGQEIGCDKYLYKLDWIAALTLWLNEINTADQPPLILGGDFNIAPSDEDVWDASLWKDKILVSEPERNAYRGLLATGVVDTWSLGLHAPDTLAGGIIARQDLKRTMAFGSIIFSPPRPLKTASNPFGSMPPHEHWTNPAIMRLS